MKFWEKRVYADAAASTPLSHTAKKELLRLLDLYGNPGSLHAEGATAKRELEAARASVAETIHAHPDEIIFVGSGTEGNNLSLQGVLRPLLQRRGQLHAVTSAIEHHSVLGPLWALKSEGLTLTELPVDEEGRVSPKDVRASIGPKTALVSLQLVNSEIGTIQEIKEIAKEVRHARKKRVETFQGPMPPLYFHTDAAQAPLWMTLDVEKLGVDLLTLDAQKVMGPKGVGALFVRRGVELAPILYGSKQESGRRGGTENVPLIGAFAAALKEAKITAEKNTERVAVARDYLFGEIKRYISDVVMNGATGERRIANNLNISIPGLDGEMAVIGLSSRGVAVTTRSACNVADSDPSHVLQALGKSSEEAKLAIRITLLPDANKRDARRIAAALQKVAERYRNVVN